MLPKHLAPSAVALYSGGVSEESSSLREVKNRPIRLDAIGASLDPERLDFEDCQFCLLRWSREVNGAQPESVIDTACCPPLFSRSFDTEAATLPPVRVQPAEPRLRL